MRASLSSRRAKVARASGGERRFDAGAGTRGRVHRDSLRRAGSLDEGGRASAGVETEGDVSVAASCSANGRHDTGISMGDSDARILTA
jgi:hypothetical protein